MLCVPEFRSQFHLLKCFGRLVCHSTPSLSLYASLNLSWVPTAPLSGWHVCLPPFTAFAALWHVTRVWCCELSSLLYPWQFSSERSALCPTMFSELAQHSTLNSDVRVRLHFAVYDFQFCWEGLVCPGPVMDYFPEVGRGAMHGAWCSSVSSAVWYRQLCSQLVGRNGLELDFNGFKLLYFFV
jgi:hypothetical protein